MTDLSVLIPGRNEMFLARTVSDVLAHAEGDTEVIVVLDGPSAYESPPDNPRVRVVQLEESIGQRAATNLAARMSEAKYVMKLDAHCSLSQGFDVAMMADMQPDWTMIPTMYNLHAFDWVCPQGHRRYQGPSGPCKDCGEPTTMDVIWYAKPNPQTTAMRFDHDLHFQYWAAFEKRQVGDLVETMSLLGACWMLTRDKYWELDICDEGHGGWGAQGTEVACKTWLSGGRLICTRRAWYAHLFRTQGGDFSFPYHMSGSAVEKAREYSRKLWIGGTWPKAKYKLDWLIEHFAPVPDWEPRPPTVGLVYYTDNCLDETIMAACQRQIKHCANGHEIVSVSLKPLDFGHNIVVDAERSILTMYRQILAGLEASTTDVVFLVEHDCLYHKSHFDFLPPRKDAFFYDGNFYQVNAKTGHALTHVWRSTSGLCAYRNLLLEHYRKRVDIVSSRGYNVRIGHEPGTHNRPERIDDYGHEMWMAEYPSIDIRHDKNLTPAKWHKEDFRSQRYTEGWRESNEVPGWGVTKGRFKELLQDILEKP